MSNPPSSEAQLQGEPLVQVMRGGIVESVHDIAACAMDAQGRIAFAAGSIDVPVFLRSSAKPFIAAAAIAAGVKERFDLEPREIAVMAASHAGQPFHVTAVRSILTKIGLDESALRCGAHAPYNAQAAAQIERDGIVPGAVYNNCSGKHAGILALCVAIGADPATYLEPDNAAERRILELCARVSDVRAGDLPLAVDGCGIPVYALSLRNAATAFARFATLQHLEESDARALRIVRDAMIAFPEYVSGTGEFDTRLMQAGAGTIACKSGAEGVHATSVIDAGFGLVVKVIDGAARGRAPAVLGALRKLHLLDARALEQLSDLERPVLQNRAGRNVGEVREKIV